MNKNGYFQSDKDGNVTKAPPKKQPPPFSGVTSWNDLTGRPFGESVIYYDAFTWTFNSDDADKYTVCEQLGLVRVSDATPTAEELKDATEYRTLFSGNSDPDAYPIGNIIDAGACIVNENQSVAVAYADNAEIEGAVFPKKGLYLKVQLYWFTSGIKTPNYRFESKFTKYIDIRYIRDMYGVAGEYSELIPETSVTTEYSNGVNVAYTVPFATMPSTVVKVVFNGAEYECIAKQTATPTGEIASYVGNGALLGKIGFFGEGHGEPFVYVAGEQDGQQMTMFAAAEAGTYTIAMYGDIERIVPVPAKYLPNLVITGDSVSGIFTANMSFEDASRALKSVGSCYLVYDVNTYVAICPLLEARVYPELINFTFKMDEGEIKVYFEASGVIEEQANGPS